MRAAVEQAYHADQTLLIEAGTGIGKTFAYLLPALQWNELSVISTHTLALQHQLVDKDLPRLLAQLKCPAKIALIKGMGNFSCLKKEAEGLDNTIADYESCTHAACPFYQKCAYFKQRKEAELADIIVVNHHLLMADLALRRASHGQYAVLPPYERLIIDEAHHLEEVATEHFATRLHRTGCIKLIQRCIQETSGQEDLLALSIPLQRRDFIEAVDHFFQHVEQLPEGIRLMEPQQQLTPTVDHLRAEWTAWRTLMARLILSEEKQQELNLFLERLQESVDAAHHWICTPLNPDEVRWIEQGTLISASLDVAPFLAEALFKTKKTLILCSATLTSMRDFTYLRSRLGIEQAEELILESPFDYTQQALLAVANDLPEPNHPDFLPHAAKWIFEVIDCSGGHAFVLFTSYAMLKECQRLLHAQLSEHNYVLFTQGDLERGSLLEAYRNTPRAILFGTDSFWEGVDVIGEQLRAVILMRLPFKTPSDPLFQARSERIAAQGGSPFFDYALPQAIVKFRQGFGRLIRHKEDRGSVVCLDPRLVKKGYGKRFLKSLPPCPVHIGSRDALSQTLRAFYFRSKLLVDDQHDAGVGPDIESRLNHIEDRIKRQDQSHHVQGNIHADQKCAGEEEASHGDSRIPNRR